MTIIGDDCFIGPGVMTTNDKWMGTGDAEFRRKNRKGPIIMDGAVIGAAAILLPGVVIGKDVIIGAGSIVTKNITVPGVYVGRGTTLQRIRAVI